MRSLKERLHAAVDLGIILTLGIAFAGMMVLAYVIWEVYDDLQSATSPTAVNASLGNITTGFDDAFNLLLVAITIFILAIAISALLMLRSR